MDLKPNLTAVARQECHYMERFHTRTVLGYKVNTASSFFLLSIHYIRKHIRINKTKYTKRILFISVIVF